MVKFEIFNSKPRWSAPQYYWRAKTKGRIIADSSEGYYKLGNAKRAVNRFVELLGATDFEIRVLD